MRPALLRGAMALPVERVDLAWLRSTLVAIHKPMGEEEGIEVQAYEEGDSYIYVPRQFGIRFCREQGIAYEDHTSVGNVASFPRIPTPRPYQAETLNRIVAATEQYYDFLFRAHTGWGKTIGSLIVAARLGRTTLIIVDQDNLKDQWLKALAQHFGMTIENGTVGIIQGKVCDYAKPIVIAMVHTLSQKTFPQKVYDHFGTVIIDEVHTVGAPTFSQVLRQFPASYRFGVSATPKRRDGLQKLLDYNLGPVRVAADKEHDESPVYFVRHPTVYSWYANISPKIGRILTEVSEDGSRNLLLAEIAVWLYQTGRDVILLADRIEQLNDMISLLYYMGVDESDLGLYAGMQPQWRVVKNPTPARRPKGLEKDAPYTPVSLQLISKKIPKRVLEEVKKKARLFHATYGMCAKGFDEPRLNAGIDLTPRGAAEQVHGRILRRPEGALSPIWVTPLDDNNYRLVNSFANRVQDYAKSNGLMYEWTEDGELIPWDARTLMRDARKRVAELKLLRIDQQPDGRYMLRTQAHEKQRKLQAVKATVAAIRSRRPS